MCLTNLNYSVIDQERQILWHISDRQTCASAKLYISIEIIGFIYTRKMSVLWAAFLFVLIWFHARGISTLVIIDTFLNDQNTIYGLLSPAKCFKTKCSTVFFWNYTLCSQKEKNAFYTQWWLRRWEDLVVLWPGTLVSRRERLSSIWSSVYRCCWLGEIALLSSTGCQASPTRILMGWSKSEESFHLQTDTNILNVLFQ